MAQQQRLSLARREGVEVSADRSGELFSTGLLAALLRPQRRAFGIGDTEVTLSLPDLAKRRSNRDGSPPGVETRVSTKARQASEHIDGSLLGGVFGFGTTPEDLLCGSTEGGKQQLEDLALSVSVAITRAPHERADIRRRPGPWPTVPHVVIRYAIALALAFHPLLPLEETKPWPG